MKIKPELLRVEVTPVSLRVIYDNFILFQGDHSYAGIGMALKSAGVIIDSIEKRHLYDEISSS